MVSYKSIIILNSPTFPSGNSFLLTNYFQKLFSMKTINLCAITVNNCKAQNIISSYLSEYKTQHLLQHKGQKYLSL